MRRSIIEAIQQHEGEGYQSVEVIEASAKYGDILEFNRGPFIHVALYIGRTKKDPDHYVLNVCAESKDDEFAPIRKEKLRDVAKNDGVRINNHDDIAKRYYGVEPRPLLRIICKVEEWNNTIVPYSFFQLNCEYYSTYLRFGKGFSTQSSLIMKSGINAPIINARKFLSANKLWFLCALPFAPRLMIPIFLGCILADLIELTMIETYNTVNAIVTHFYERDTEYTGPRWMLKLYQKIGFDYRHCTCPDEIQLIDAIKVLLELHPGCHPAIRYREIIKLIWSLEEALK